MMMGLESFSIQESPNSCAYLGPDELLSLRTLLSGDRAVTIWTTLDARVLVRRLGLLILSRLSDRSLLSWDDIRATLTVFASPNVFKRNSVDFGVAQSWCLQGFNAGGSVAAKVWLQQSLKEAVSLFIEQSTEASVQAQILHAKSVAVVATLLLGHDAGGLGDALAPLVSRLLRLRTGSAYASKGIVERCIVLTSQLLFCFYECDENVDLSMEWFEFSQCKDEIYEVVKSGLFASVDMSFGLVDEYCTLLRILLGIPSESSLVGRIQELWTTSWATLRNEKDSNKDDMFLEQVRKFSALKVLHIVFQTASKISFFDLKPCDESSVTFILVESKLKRSLNSNEERNKNWGELQHIFQNSQYDCVRALNKYVSAASRQGGSPNGAISKVTFSLCLDGLSDASYVTASYMFRLIASLLDDDWPIQMEEVAIVAKAGKFLVEENWNNARYFASIVREFANTMFHRKFLETDFGEDGNNEIVEAFSVFLKWGELKMPIVANMAKVALDFWSLSVLTDPKHEQHKKAALSSLKRYYTTFIRLLLFGPLWDLNKDQRRMDASISVKVREMDKDLGSSVANLDPEDARGTAEMNFSNKDYTIRVRANDILARLDPASKDECDFAMTILSEMLRMYLSGKHDALFASSFEHRVQLRMWCSIHLLLDHIAPEDLEQYIQMILDCIEMDSVISTRFYIEWAVLRLLIRAPRLMPIFLDRLERFDRKAHIVCSYLLIASHIGRHIPPEEQKSFFPLAFTRLMPWITTNHFSIRLYAQFAPIAIPAMFLESNPDCIKHRQKADKVYFLSDAFDPVLDVSIGFIFQGAMIVADVTEEERISSQAFERLNPLPGRKVRLHHDIKKTGYWVSGLSELQPPRPEEELKPALGDAPLQRKIVPWEAMMMTDIDSKRRLLANFFAIFNAQLLVLGNARVKDDPTFQSTAVTSDRWMPTIEVREPDLLDYLLQKKKEGYSVLGIEQATTSVSLEKFSFPKQSVLVLGKEKEGIPAHVLPLLDFILEIPQFGVIRSLNVHVSGALIVWEYTRQQSITHTAA
ncbi:hypothetical protein BC829DRAFT_383772 [Chytridium lagenaria]|nr:hypothetical protein BC829DRAFT_383772 [Chytridium lagenaria]